MTIFWIWTLIFFASSFFVGILAGKTLEFNKLNVKKNNRDTINKDDLNVDIVKKRQRLEHILNEEKLLKEDIHSRIISRRIIRIKKTLKEIDKKILEIAQEIQKLDNDFLINEKEKDKQKLENFRDSLKLTFETLTGISRKTGSQLGASIWEDVSKY